jgi:hypothetical protein
MSVERKKILEMLAAGKITAEDADRLLDKLSSGRLASSEPSASAEEAASSTDGKSPRYLRIVVEKPGGDNVNMRVPLNFLRAQSGLLAILPQRVLDKLADSGIDVDKFSSLRGKGLEAALQELNIEVEQNSGKKVRLYCE